ncbi:histone-lysine N-methyltransferase SETMAR [Trichonephila clavipes]|nr:histone-lysine N-methyltransferase SETMAR [Trichonephila clavipes]
MQKKKVLFHQDNTPCHKSMKTMVKLNELHFKLLFHPPHSSDLAPSGYWLCADLKRVLQRKIYGLNEEVIAEVEAYFESKDKSFYKKVLKN